MLANAKKSSSISIKKELDNNSKYKNKYFM